MKTPRLLFAALIAALKISSFTAHAEAPVRIQGIGSLLKVVKAIAPALREQGIEIKVGEESTNAQAAAALSSGAIDLALLGRALTAEERASYPEQRFDETQVGMQTIALLVARPLWEMGVQALKREQVAELYERQVRSWEQFGGGQSEVKFFEPVHGHGVWEIFALWLYSDVRKAPAVPWEVLNDGRESQTVAQFQSGAITVAALRWADRREVFPLGIIDESGVAVEATPANAVTGKYPLSRPLFIVAGDRPTGHKRKIIEFFKSQKGRAAMVEGDLLPMLGIEKP